MKRNLVPFVLLGLAFFFAYMVWRDPATTSDGERALRKDNVFASWRRDAVTRVALDGETGELRLDRDAAKNEWSMHGSTDEVDAARADVLFGELEHAVVLRKVDADEGTGLRVPRVRGEIAMGDITYKFVLGGDAKKPEGAAYLQIEGDGAVVVEKRLAEALLAKAVEYRDKRLLPAKGDGPTELSIVPSDGPPFSIVKDGRTRHRLGKDGAFASRLESEALLSALAELRAVKFLGIEAGRLATQGSAVSLTVRLASGDRTFAFGGACPGAPLDVAVERRMPTPVFACVPQGIVGTLRRPVSTYEDRLVFFVRPDELEEVKLVRAGQDTLDLARKGSGFRLRAPESRDLDSEASDGVRAWVTSLVSLAGEPTIPPTSETVEISRVVVVYGKVTEDVRFVRAAEGRVLGLRSDGRAIVLSREAEQIVSPPRAFSRKTSLFPASRTLRELWLDCEGLSQHVVRKDGLRFAQPEPFPLDAALAAQAVSTLVSARAEAWVSDTRAGFVPASPKCTARLLFEPESDAGRNDFTLELSSPDGPKVQGAVVGESEVFLAPRELVEAMRRPLASRSAFMIDPARAFDMTVFFELGARKVSMDEDAGAGSSRDVLEALRPLFVVKKGAMTAAEEGNAPVRIEVGLLGDGGPTYAKYRFGKEFSAPEGKLVYAVRDGVPFIFAVRAELAEPFRALVGKRP